MRNAHKETFFQVADRFTCWIGLREPNPLADNWIGRAGYIPKDEHCKAKTADNPTFAFAGLVTDPRACPAAFQAGTRAEAVRAWEKFAPNGRMPPGYSVVAHGREAGLVKLHGSFIYADFDLMAILRSNKAGEFLETSQSEQLDLFRQVQPALNQGLYAPMIQHGAEFMWDQGVGARESEFVLWFGPGHRFQRWPSSMPRAGH